MDCRSKPKTRPLSISATCVAVVCLGLLSGSAAAETELKSEGMTIYGQSELPKVLYIVPWKRRQAGEIDMPTSKSLASDVLEPIDPEIFRRQIRYHELIMQSQHDKSSQP